MVDLDRKTTEIVDILSSHVSLEWERCKNLPVKMRNAQAVLFNDKLYVGGGLSKNKLKQDEAKLYVYSHKYDKWGMAVSTPSYWFALVVYQSRLVLVGGRVYDDSDKPGPLTNQLWVMSDTADQLEQDENLPAMSTKRHSASAVSHKESLLVAGGHLGSDTATLQEENALDIVEVYNGHQWASTQSLPKKCWHMKSIIFEDNWWLMGGYGQEEEVFCTSLDSLIRTAVCSSYHTNAVWKQLPKVHHSGSSLAVLPGNKVVAIGGEDTADVLTYTAQSRPRGWLPMGKLPADIVSNTCTITLPTGEVLAIGGEGRILDYLNSVFKGTPTLNKVLWNDIICELDKLNESQASQKRKHLERELAKEAIGSDEEKFQLVDEDKVSLKKVPVFDSRVENLQTLEQDMSTLKINKEIKVEEATGNMKSASVIAVNYPKEHVPSKQNGELSTAASWKLVGVEDLQCGETSVVVYASKPFQWEHLGLKLYIEEGSLPPGIDQCTINIKVSLAGQYEFPEKCYLVSAILWLRCETIVPSSEFRFTKPVKVEIQHCAKLKNASKLSFVRAVCNQKDLPYVFKHVPNGSFSTHSAYGFIELYSFSGVSIVQKGSDDKEYCYSLYYLNQQGSIDSDIYFVVTLNTKVHLTVVIEEYTNKKARFGPDQKIEFEADRITLSVPLDSTTVSDGWQICSFVPPVILKSEVDCYIPGKKPPQCHIKVSHNFSQRRRSSPPLRQQIKLDGAKEPFNVFVIDLPAIDGTGIKRSISPLGLAQDFPSRKKSRSESDLEMQGSIQEAIRCADITMSSHSGIFFTTGLDTKLDLDKDHARVISYLKVLQNDHIRELGGILGIAYTEMNRINGDLHDMVAAWLRKQNYVEKDPTWRILIEALRKVGQTGIADDIEKAEKWY